jgi:hypothetical protein
MRNTILLLMTFVLASIFGKNLTSNSEIKSEFVSRVTLKTNCEVNINTFALKNMNSGAIVRFRHGEAFIRAKEDDKLQVILNPEYKNVQTAGVPVYAKLNLEIFHDCKNSVTLENIFDSMNKQFDKNK